MHVVTYLNNSIITVFVVTLNMNLNLFYSSFRQLNEFLFPANAIVSIYLVLYYTYTVRQKLSEHI